MSASASTSAVALEIAVVIAVPSMIVNDHAATPGPISLEKHVSLVPGGNPVRPRIWRARVVSVVPQVMAIDWIPVTLDPDIRGLRRWRRSDVHDARRWRRTNLNSD
jgi:hypothetical protein